VSRFPSVLSLGIPGVFDNSKFELISNKIGYRAIFQAISECPNGQGQGCVICSDYPNSRRGYHPRPIAREAVSIDLRRRMDGLPDMIAHRWLDGEASIVVGGMTLMAGVDFLIVRRVINWLTPLCPQPGDAFHLSYIAYEEDWVNMQHATGAMIGLSRRSEKTLNLVAGNLTQGQIALSIPPSSRGFMSKDGDRWLPADALMRFQYTIDLDRANWDCYHQFVDNVVSAFGLDSHNQEVPVPITHNALTRQFETTADHATLPQRIVVEYDACPIYFVYLDSGEFRAPMGGQDHHRLVILSREEQSS
jgi:hypothetical protein